MNSLISNNHTTNFYNYITKHLNECKSFTFNVAFINFSGLQLLLDSFKSLENKNIKGKILTSTYLNFTEVRALEKILEFSNIELKIYTNNDRRGFHSKAYIFEYSDYYETVIGSSNITSSAFKNNIEWNMSSTNKKDDELICNILNEFNFLWNESIVVDSDFLSSYLKHLKSSSSYSDTFIYKNDIKANSMQIEALNKLEVLRYEKQKKALVIASTGTGKTYLAALDVKEFRPKKLLFLVHQENILLKAKSSFENIINDYSCGLYTGNKKDRNCDYIFSTIQTMSKHYKNFANDEFDYIIVDEAHHITSKSYRVVIDYFDCKFLLGLTATPNRMDENSIYEYFDDNIACEIKLHDALDNKLVTPFHYYGIDDINEVNYDNVDLSNISELSKLLMINKRVDYIIEKMNFYSYSGNKRKTLAFCSSKEHARFMSEEFNKRGINSEYLTSEDNIKRREDVICKLEDELDSLEVIFTIDIFNEGIDIPSINTVLMLRPTSSSIVFIQQLGRGLRKYKNKDFLTILDFIGNHTKSYLIAFALLGNKIIDKESVKLSIKSDFANIQNAFISMDSISKERILKQIDNENLNSMKYLKEEYFEFKKILGNKIPNICDYLSYDELISPLKFISESKSYIEFLKKVEKSKKIYDICLDDKFVKCIRFIEFLLPIRRIYEFIVLKYLLHNDFCTIDLIYNELKKYLDIVDKNTILHCFEYLGQKYLDKSQISRYLKLVDVHENKLVKSNEFTLILLNKEKRVFIEDSIHYGIIRYEKEFAMKDYGYPFFKIYEKYNMLNIAQVCNFNKIHSSFRGSGFLKYENNFFLFISIEKDKLSKASKYKNDFESKDIFNYVSKPLMSQKKGDGEKLINNIKHKTNLHIFARKYVQVDKKTQSFIYLGLADTFSYYGDKPIYLKLKLRKALSNEIYDEFTKIID